MSQKNFKTPCSQTYITMSTTTSGSPLNKIGKGNSEAVIDLATTEFNLLARITLAGGRPNHSLPRVSENEAAFYYVGLPSRPKLVARTGSIPYKKPTGPEPYHRHKELRIVGSHNIQDVWEDELAPKVHSILGEKGVDWTSTDVVRIGYVKNSKSRVVLWIGVKPSSLSYDDGIEVALLCKQLLLDHGLNDIDVEIRESELIYSSGPKLLETASSYLDKDDSIVTARMPFTSTLGSAICSQSTPWAEGTSGFFLDEGGDGKRLFLVTTRHVIFPPDKQNNNLLYHKSDTQCRHNVLVLSDVSFKQHLVSIQNQIKSQYIKIDLEKRRTQKYESNSDEWKYARKMWKKSESNVKELTAFQLELSTQWASEQSRILGYVLFSPPIIVSADTEQYIQDLAVIAIDDSKIDPSSFAGNVIDLGNEFFSGPGRLRFMMCPNPRNSHDFQWPVGLLSLQGIIKDDELHKPTMYDEDNQCCLIVLKRGKATDLTVGYSNNIFSYTRNYLGCDGISKQWVILPFYHKSSSGGNRSHSDPFSAKGDSGSVIADGAGRIGGILTGGGGLEDSFDVSYATPADFIMKTIRSCKDLANAYPRDGPAPSYYDHSMVGNAQKF